MSFSFATRRAAALPCLLFVAVTISCTDSQQPLAPREGIGRSAATADLVDRFMQFRPLDRVFWKIAHDVPGFGGAYLDLDGTPVVVLLDTNALASATRALRAALVTEKDTTMNRRMRAVLGQYDFITLATWLFQATPVHSVAGVVGAGIDERRNRLIVRLSDDAALSDITKSLNAAGVPIEGVIVERAAPVMFSSSLTDLIRPVANGYMSESASISCTIGLNASQNGTGDAYAVVPSHCTAIKGQVDGTEFFQPSSTIAPNSIGVEIDDTPYFAGDGSNGCAIGRYCTYADAALMKYHNNSDQDPIFSIPITDFRAAPGQGPGSTNVCCYSQIYAVEGYDILPAMQGQTLDRIGPTAGWTFGQVIDKCYDANIVNTNLTILCQTQVSGLQGAGDSGSQVFSSRNPTFYYLYGMATLTETDNSVFYYTPMSTIMQQLHTNSYPLAFCVC